MRVLLDSNALLMPFQYNLNLDSELTRLLGDYEVYVPSCVLGELRKLSKRRWEAKAALQLAEKYTIVEVKNLGDKGVIEAAKKLKAVVVTNDKALRIKLLREKIKVIFMKQNHLVIIDDLT
ncbi:MAG: twitching motility protein PilT [Thermoplasmata archaeon]|nr:twitching motility protein PilT [Thermoplasmata archaeon]